MRYLNAGIWIIANTHIQNIHSMFVLVALSCWTRHISTPWCRLTVLYIYWAHSDYSHWPNKTCCFCFAHLCTLFLPHWYTLASSSSYHSALIANWSLWSSVSSKGSSDYAESRPDNAASAGKGPDEKFRARVANLGEPNASCLQLGIEETRIRWDH